MTASMVAAEVIICFLMLKEKEKEKDEHYLPSSSVRR